MQSLILPFGSHIHEVALTHRAFMSGSLARSYHFRFPEAFCMHRSRSGQIFMRVAAPSLLLPLTLPSTTHIYAAAFQSQARALLTVKHGSSAPNPFSKLHD